jgi:hypothetical protein
LPQPRYLRVVCFRPAGPESTVDAALRRAIPRLLDHDDVHDAWLGRKGSPADQRRVLASTWLAEPGPQPLDVRILADAELPSGTTIDDPIDELPLAIHARFDRPEPARILRVFRGRVMDGELDAYIREASRGMAADAEVNDGLIAFALGTRPPDAFLTVSAWTGWSAIEAATGGNTKRPFATRNSERLSGFTVAHYELVPETPDRRS